MATWCSTVIDVDECLAGVVDTHVNVFVADVMKSCHPVDRCVIEDSTPHRTQHTRIFSCCATCSTVVSDVHVSSNAPALAQLKAS